MKLVACGTALVTMATGIVFLVAGHIWLSSISIAQSIALGAGVFRRQVLLERVAELSLLATLIVLGLAWPSIFTLLAALALPALALGSMNLLKWRARPRGATFVIVVCFVAAGAMLAQAAHLVSISDTTAVYRDGLEDQ